jgi:hypothetical protein
MTIQYINTGTSPNAGDGDSLRLSFTKINQNFTYLSTASFGGGGNGYVGSEGGIGYTGSEGGIGYIGSLGYTGSQGSEAIVRSSTAPANTSTLWYDTVSGRSYVYYDDSWVDSSPQNADSEAIVQSDTAPANTSTLWYDTISGRSYVYYDDSWVDASPQTVGYTGYTGSQGSSMTLVSNTTPTGQTTGTFWYSSITGRTYIRFDDSWVDASPTSSGYTGSQGYNGSVGYTGSQGGIGYTGSTGADSTVPGYVGSEGGIGYTGSTGADGIGYIGSTGADSTVPGYVGSEGGIGYTGSTGADGIGYTGSEGGNGYDGSIGYTGSAGISSFSSIRDTFTTSTVSLTVGNTATTIITGFKTYVLYKIETSVASWVRLYTDEDSQINDISRDPTSDPLPGTGIIAEVITTVSKLEQLITPGVIGFNNDTVPTDTIYINVTNNSNSTQIIDITLTLLQLES